MTETVEAKQTPLKFPMTDRNPELYLSATPHGARVDGIFLCIAGVGVEASRRLEWDDVVDLADWLNKALEQRP